MPLRRQSRRQVLGAAAAMAFATAVRPANAQTASPIWPTKPVKIIVPFAAGGNTDGIARVIGQWLGELFGQQFVIENRAGANGAIAAEAVVRSAPDGYTLFIAALPQIAVLPAMTRTAYDPVKDFAPVSDLGTNPFVLTTNPGFAPKTLAEFVAYVQARPTLVPYGSGGIGSLGHLTMALFLKRAGLEMVHVPYKGGGPAMADTVAGHVSAYFGNLSEVLPFAANGQIRPLAISSLERSEQLPEVPTVAESGFPGYNVTTWNGLMAPAGTPKGIIDRLAEACAAGVRDATVIGRLHTLGVDPLGDGPEAFAATIAADIPLWAEAVRIAGVASQ